MERREKWCDLSGKRKKENVLHCFLTVVKATVGCLDNVPVPRWEPKGTFEALFTTISMGARAVNQTSSW